MFAIMYFFIIIIIIINCITYCYCTGENYMQKRKTNIALHWVEISNRRARVLLKWVKEKKIKQDNHLQWKQNKITKCIYLFTYMNLLVLLRLIYCVLVKMLRSSFKL